MHRHLGRGEKPGSHDYATGAQAERGRQTSPIRDAPSSHDGQVSGDLDDLRDQHQSADEPAVSTGLTTLGDDDVGSAVDRTTCLVDVHHPCCIHRLPARWARSTRSPGSPMWYEITAGRASKVASNASGLNGLGW